LPPTPEQLDHALTERPDIRVVAVNSHTVMGACADLKALKAVALRHGDTPLVVDGAWAGGRISYIRKLLADGAAVVTTSYHKRLPVLTQNGAVYVPAGSPISADDIEQRLSELHTTSPSSLLLSSTVAGVHGEIHSGEKRFAKLAQRVDRMRSALNKIDGIHVLGRTISLGEGSSRRDFELDPTNLVLKIDGYADGADVRAQLHKHHVSILGTDGDYVNFALPAGLSQKMEAELLTRIRLVAQEAPRAPQGVAAEPVPAAPQRMSIYDAAQARHEFVPLTAAAGRIAGDLASVIPPGSTTIAPGEEITAEMSGYLQRLLAAGVEVSGIKSGGLIRVVA
jgi:arginine/lysine/ornithine decarboxylase